MITMQAVRRDSSSDLINPFHPKDLLRSTKSITAEQPMLPASEGVKKPFRSPPMTIMKIMTGHNTSGSICSLADQENLSLLGATAGFIVAQPIAMRIKQKLNY
jgi:hypothetical protein